MSQVPSGVFSELTRIDTKSHQIPLKALVSVLVGFLFCLFGAVKRLDYEIDSLQMLKLITAFLH